jgi:hypothetical protein
MMTTTKIDLLELEIDAMTLKRQVLMEGGKTEVLAVRRLAICLTPFPESFPQDKGECCFVRAQIARMSSSPITERP